MGEKKNLYIETKPILFLQWKSGVSLSKASHNIQVILTAKSSHTHRHTQRAPQNKPFTSFLVHACPSKNPTYAHLLVSPTDISGIYFWANMVRLVPPEFSGSKEKLPCLSSWTIFLQATANKLVATLPTCSKEARLNTYLKTTGKQSIPKSWTNTM